MKRSDFLALIPALSATPLLAKNFVKSDKGIFLESPVPLEVASMPHMPSGAQLYDMKVKLYVEENGVEMQIGSATVREINMDRDLIYHEINGGYDRRPGAERWSMNCDIHFNWV